MKTFLFNHRILFTKTKPLNARVHLQRGLIREETVEECDSTGASVETDIGCVDTEQEKGVSSLSLPLTQSLFVSRALHTSTMALSDRELLKNLRVCNAAFVSSAGIVMDKESDAAAVGRGQWG